MRKRGRAWMRAACCVVPAVILGLALAGCGGGELPSPTAVPPTAEQPTAMATAATVEATATPVAEESVNEPTATPTPTAAAGVAPTATTRARGCATFQGALEVQVLVGPADAVGMEPVSVGTVPLAVTGGGNPVPVGGSADATYDDSQEHDWGTYAVTMAMDLSVDGTCSGAAGAEQLDLVLDMSGEQNILVTVGGMQWSYPWSGTQQRELSLPLADGASASGEGWQVVLHLGG